MKKCKLCKQEVCPVCTFCKNPECINCYCIEAKGKINEKEI